MKRLRLMIVGLVFALTVAMVSQAFAAGSLLGTVTAIGILDSAVDVVPYFGGVILLVVGVSAGIWVIGYLIRKLKGAFRGK